MIKRKFVIISVLAVMLSIGLLAFGVYTASGESHLNIQTEISYAPNVDFTYTLDNENNGLVITGYTGTSKYLEIPEELIYFEDFDSSLQTLSMSTSLNKEIHTSLPKYNVIGIGDSAFKNNSSIISVTLPNTLTQIADSAFYGCTALKKINIPENVTTIGNSAFYNCTALTEINYNATQANDLSSSNNVFYYAGQSGDGITVIIGDNVEKIPAYLFNPYNNIYTSPKITSLTIGSGVKFIGNYAFAHCLSIPSLTLPENLQTIGNYAFYYCTAIPSLTIPNNVTTIENYAFAYCTSLTEINYNATSVTDLSSNNRVFFNAGKNGDGITVTIGDNVTNIPAYLFNPYSNSSYSPKITSLTIGSGVKTIGNYAFYECQNINQINYNAKNANDLASSNRVFYNAGKNGDGITVTIGDNVEKIPAYLFCPYSSSSSSPKITTLTIGSGVQTIGENAFSYCSSLTTLTIPENVQTIGENAFKKCSSLTTLTIGSGVQTIGNHAFVFCTSLTSITVDENNANYTDYNSNCIIDKNLQSTTYKHLIVGCNATVIPEDEEIVTAIGDCAFYGSSLQTLTIPENIQTIGNYAFYECTALTEINYNALQANDLSSSNYVFYDAGKNGNGITVTIGDNVEKIPAYLFNPYNDIYTSPKITTLTIGSGVQTIGEDTFSYCSSLTSITVDENNTNFADYNSNCIIDKNLESETYRHLIAGCKTTVIPEDEEIVTAIGDRAFYGSSLQTLTIPENIQTIGNYAFYNCTALTEINYNAKNANDLAYRNYVFYNAGKNGNGITVTIGDNVEKIPAYLFNPYSHSSFSPKITSLTIGSGVQTIGNHAFYGCTALTEINYNALQANDLSSSNYVFYDAGKNGDGITVTIGDNVTNIPAYLFCPCTSSYSPKITSLTIGSGVQTIGNHAFVGCNSLTSITVDENNANYTDYNSNCIIDKNLQSTTYQHLIVGCKTTVIPEDEKIVTAIGDYAFYSSSLQTLTIPENIQTIGNYAFNSCSSLTTLTIGSGVQTIGNNAFYNCTTLTSVYYHGTEAEKTATLTSIDNTGNAPLTNATWYYYNEDTTTTVAGNYWYYNNGEIVPFVVE